MKNKLTLILFSAVLGGTPLTARNYFSPYSDAFTPVNRVICLSHSAPNPGVEQFDLLEYGFDLPESMSNLIGTGKGKLNPFDPEQVNVVAEFKQGSEIDTVYGFYYEDFIRDESSIKAVYNDCPEAKWIQQPTEYKWHVRFAPPKTGAWTMEIKVYVAFWPVPQTFSVTTFEVVNTKNRGFLMLNAGEDPLHFITSGDHKSFFCLGQDIAWPDGSRFRGAVNPAFDKLVAGGFMDVQDWTANLGDNGGNMIRVVNVPWSYELEWDTVGVYNMARAWELDSLFSTCEKSNVKMVFCLEHGTYTLPAWYEEHLMWEKHPYHRFMPGIQMPEDFLTDTSARKAYKKKLHYFLARWGYSTSLGIVQILSEMEHWTLRGPEVELKNNKAVQKKFLIWHNEMLAYMKQEVSYRPLLTSTSYGQAPRDFSVNAFSSPYLDVVCPRHSYFTERNDNLMRWYEVNTANPFEKGIHGMFPKKAAIIDEMGFGTLVGDPNDIDACSDVTYHNSLWASAFSGTAGAGLYWWRWGGNEYREQNFPALASFFSKVDFENYPMNRSGHWEDASRPSRVGIETFYLVSDEPRRSFAIGWVHNASYWWGNISQNCKDRNGRSTLINSRTGDDENISAPQELKPGTKFEVHDLAGSTQYVYVWYNTRKVEEEIYGGVVKTNILGTAKIEWKSGAGDWGYTMQRKDDFDKEHATTIVLPSDHITTISDTMVPANSICAFMSLRYAY